MPQQTTDIFAPSATAISFSSAGQTWKIAKDIDVGSGSSPAVSSFFANSTLVNRGNVFSHGSDGVSFTGDNATFLNKDGGVVNGGNYGVLFDTSGDDATLVNLGKIIGGTIGAYSDGPGDLAISNEGKIYGYTYGILISGTADGSTPGPAIMNSGKIVSDKFAIRSLVDTGLRTKIINDKDGVILGGTLDATEAGAALVYSGVMKLVNKGKMKGDISNNDGPELDDTIVNKGKIKGEVFFGDGDDTYRSKGGSAGRLHGEEGNDKFVLGSKADKIVFDTALSAATNADRVRHFDPGKDVFFLDVDVFTTLPQGQLSSGAFHKGPSATSPGDRIIHRKGTGEVFYDPDGSGGAPQTLFAKVDAGTNLQAGDFVVIA